MPLIEKEFVQTGKLRYFFLDFPLRFHSQAFKAAEAAECAGEQGKFWQMHDKLFANQKALKSENLPEHAKALELDLSKFQGCLDSGKYAEEINKDMAEGKKAGVTGTPAFLLGWIESNGKTVKAVKFIRGAQPYSAFKEAIESLLGPHK